MEETDVQLASDVVLSQGIKSRVKDHALKFLRRYVAKFGFAQMHIHLKYEGAHVACLLNLTTDHGKYHARAEAWNVRGALLAALEGIGTQMTKYVEKRVAHGA